MQKRMGILLLNPYTVCVHVVTVTTSYIIILSNIHDHMHKIMHNNSTYMFNKVYEKVPIICMCQGRGTKSCHKHANLFAINTSMLLSHLPQCGTNSKVLQLQQLAVIHMTRSVVVAIGTVTGRRSAGNVITLHSSVHCVLSLTSDITGI